MTESMPPHARQLDAGALRALAHPLRVELFEELSVRGCATASQLAERLGESSGSTSYHLRQLERHGLVREVEERGTNRERWWERTPGSIGVSYFDYDDAAGRTAARMVGREWERARAALLDDFHSNPDLVGRDWYEASSISTSNVTATVDELHELGRAWLEFLATHVDPLRNRDDVVGARRVQVHFNAFPLLDRDAADQALLARDAAAASNVTPTPDPTDSEQAES
ncbi:ArsR/SmtB family transcription factor [Frondihabitans australicus]|nr:helix-turn-helix domain-containing protein [Frondihabitans australicus]